jgi:hypothetical protein
MPPKKDVGKGISNLINVVMVMSGMKSMMRCYCLIIICVACSFSLPHNKNEALRECKREYIAFLRGGPDNTDCLDSLKPEILEGVLEQTILELKYLNAENVYWFAKTGKKFREKGKLDSLFLLAHDSCIVSLWKALYLFKKEPMPNRSTKNQCVLIDTIISHHKDMDSLTLDSIHTKYSDHFGY